ncbi:MAG: RsmB/NOP family class I SAM-dependent RNA methyltransferase [Candidatus Omnitrophica bacterium]|nr:RsmB/NOP family class I SAM-dependent RNA methyltransferase [Candidatus Omnitrophota bacterium]
MDKIIYKLPHEFIKRLKKIYPKEFPAISETFLHRKNPFFRINYLKTDLTSLRRDLQKENIKFKELSFPQGAFLLKSPLRKLQNTIVYEQGHLYVQNLSSMLPAIFLEPEGGDKILDLCAAPGAKTTQIASLAPNAEIIAIEKVRKRYYKLLSNLKKQGASSVNAYLLDGGMVRKKFPEGFNKVLVDASCSAEGRFFVHNPKSFKYWKLKKIKEMVRKQKKLLGASFFACAEGGAIIYSTCTMAPEENEEIIDWFINKFEDCLEILPLKIPLPNIESGKQRWKNKRFLPHVARAKRIIPTDSMEGFFIAKIKKIASR